MQAYIISHLKKEMPSMFGKDSKKKELINKLGDVYKVIQRDYGISAGDFPSLEKMQTTLEVCLRLFPYSYSPSPSYHSSVWFIPTLLSTLN